MVVLSTAGGVGAVAGRVHDRGTQGVLTIVVLSRACPAPGARTGCGAGSASRIHVGCFQHGGAVSGQQFDFDFVAVGCETCNRAAVGQRLVVGDEVRATQTAVVSDGDDVHSGRGVGVGRAVGLVGAAVGVHDDHLFALPACCCVDAQVGLVHDGGADGVLTIRLCGVVSPAPGA